MIKIQMEDLKSRDVTALPPYRNLAPRFTSTEEVTRGERLQRITAEGENLDNSNEEIPRFPTWLLLRNDGSTEPCRSKSSFSS
jgi:hypothetical protein